MINPGEVAYLKTTGEAVFVLAHHADEEPHGKIFKVRRPVAGQSGIYHQTDLFFEAELETLDEQRKKFMAEREEIVRKYGPKTETSESLPIN